MGYSGIVADGGMNRKIVAWSMMSKPHTKTPEEENAPKPPSLRPDTTDLRIWATHERSAGIMKAHGYDPTTDFCKSPKNTSRFATLVGQANG
jgi:hypothetical protein